MALSNEMGIITDILLPGSGLPGCGQRLSVCVKKKKKGDRRVFLTKRFLDLGR